MVVDGVTGRVLSTGKINTKINAETFVTLLAFKVVVGQCARIEYEVTGCRDDLSGTQMGIAADGDVHRSIGNEAGLLSDPVRFSRTAATANLHAGQKLASAEAEAGRGGVVGVCTGIWHGQDREITTDIGSDRVPGDHRTRETRIVS
ncbi:hypothetical protein D3C87_887600 [compost metagenome]